MERLGIRAYEASMTVDDHTLAARRATPEAAEGALLDLLEDTTFGRERGQYRRSCRARGLVTSTVMYDIETERARKAAGA